MPRYNAVTEDFEEVTIFGRPALFTDIRIDRNSVPRGYHMYEVRHDDDCQGDAVQIGRNIIVNYWGTLITCNKIRLGPDGLLDISPKAINYGCGDCRNLKEFMEAYPPKVSLSRNYSR